MVKALVVACLMIGGCQSAPKGTFCALADAQRPSQEAIDKLTDAQVAALLRHNRLGGKLCGWKP